jgi:ribosomal protein S19E (S16A)
MDASETPPLSTSERQTLRYVADNEFHETALDWVALQRLKRLGLVEERGKGVAITKAGRQTLQSMA